MKAGALMDYDFDSKNKWRVAIWKEIARRCAAPLSHAVVLYMPGAEDFDAFPAKRVGFDENHMIGVERERKIVEKIRKRGRICIHGDFLQVMHAWPTQRYPDVVFGDFTGTVSDKMSSVLTHNRVPGVCYAMNVLRGRESASDELREWIQVMARCGRGDHRFLMKRIYDAINVAEYAESVGKDYWTYMGLRMRDGVPCFKTYISTSGQRFDSQVTGGKYDGIGVDDRSCDDRDALASFIGLTDRRRKSIRQQIACALALLTTRTGTKLERPNVYESPELKYMRMAGECRNYGAAKSFRKQAQRLRACRLACERPMVQLFEQMKQERSGV